MKKIVTGSITVLSMLCCYGGLITFDNASDLTGNFTEVAEGSAGTYDYSTAAGVGGTSGRVDANGIINTSGDGLYTIAQVDPDNGPITVSMYFLAQAYTGTGGGSRVALGLSYDNSLNMSGNVLAQVRLLAAANASAATFEVRSAKNDSAGQKISTTGVTLVEDHWYKMEATFSVWGTSSMDVIATVTDYGTDGVTLGSIIANAKAGVTTTAFVADGDRLPVYVGTLLQSDGGGAKAMDNMVAPVAVPEPATLGLFVFSATGILLVRRHIRK